MTWVVYFNYLLLVLASTEPDRAEDVQMLRQNTQASLNHSSIFLEPRDGNVQALMILAMHGEDFAARPMSPGCWWDTHAGKPRPWGFISVHRVTTTYTSRVSVYFGCSSWSTNPAP